MRTLLLSLCLASVASAQSSLTTYINGSMNSPVGSVSYFDLDVKEDLTLTALDVHLNVANPNSSIDVWVRNGSWQGNVNSPAGWTQVIDDAVIPSPQSNGSFSNVPLPGGVPLLEGIHGVMIRYNGSSYAFSDGLFPIGKFLAGNADLDIFEGGVGSAPFSGLTGAPRVWEGRLFYEPIAPVAATETVRLGVPANPNVFMPGLTNGPVIGATWDPWVDHSSFAPNAFIDLLIASPTPVNIPLESGTLLCSDSGTLFFVAIAPNNFSVPIPNNPSIVGASFCTQAASVTLGGDVQLTNALDLVLGNF
ncbi:MAG: hypothetical protein ACYS26_13870 [Planctomycetota bacterium]|jgi:hypothetical protein